MHWSLQHGNGAHARLRAAEGVVLDAEYSAHRFIQELHGHTVGFTCSWLPGPEPSLIGAPQ